MRYRVEATETSKIFGLVSLVALFINPTAAIYILIVALASCEFVTVNIE